MEDYKARRRRQSADTRKAILAAALELCRSSSFDQVSVRDICRRAGITTGAFYHHFSSKNELLRQGFASLDVFMEQALAGHACEAPTRRLALILENYAHFMQSLGWELTARYYQQRLGCEEFVSMDASRYTLRAIRACLDQAEALGLLPPGVGAAWAADFLFRHFRGVVIDWTINHGRYDLLDKLRQDYQFFCKSFCAGRCEAQEWQNPKAL